MKKPVILLAERDEALRQSLHPLLLSRGFTVLTSCDLTGLVHTLRQQQPPDLLIVSTGLDGTGDGAGVVRLLCEWRSKPPVILIAPQSSEELAIAALKAGVADYFKHPFSSAALLASVRRCLLPKPPGEPQPPPAGGSCGDEMIGGSPSMQEIKAYLRKVAAS